MTRPCCADLSEAASGIAETVYEGVGSAQEILEAAEKRIYALRQAATRTSRWSTSARCC